MLESVQRFFRQVMANPGQPDESSPTLELAAAALLCEIMRADFHTAPSELATLRALLTQHFRMSEADIDELMALAQDEVENSVDHYQFVSLVKQHYSYQQRVELVRMMWALALADGEHHPLEEHRIRQLADLMHVSHADFIRTKLQVKGE
ncbi:TerB family tellurite resistance protein [Halomonas urumqiensis]|uniref:TerB family tellurite resistance protein n=1 Tax=Halomonas urumqiensis TaxID=1684789 RepID=A0A2N7ULM8_9GAMM|nr:TerB family tellurite resistance protein [Halomonas urumqiensis]PMR81337.1 TerB family tellurite resistance protein [Halomonas urumqiensis]PTB01137.1 TerB family tellurite resistance protein [Halomonas urumqiensis]GHE22704.1 hypothetical protein GCM10017767_32250 [Halomonas urumqiensis]